MKIVGNIVIYFALYLIYEFSGLSRYPSGFTFMGFLGGAAMAAPLLLFGSWLVSKAAESEQVVEDNRANDLINRNRLTTETFFLYLRPFSSTNAYRISDAHLNLFSWELWERDGFDDLERIVSRALRPTAKFIALGKPGEHRGAARIVSSEKDWQERLTKLVRAAKLVIVIPSFHEGTLWELRLLKEEGYLSKTIFIAPPINNAMYISNSDETLAEWTKTQNACFEISIALPETPSEGAVFKVADNGNILTVLPLPPPDPVAWMRALQSLIDA